MWPYAAMTASKSCAAPEVVERSAEKAEAAPPASRIVWAVDSAGESCRGRLRSLLPGRARWRWRGQSPKRLPSQARSSGRYETIQGSRGRWSSPPTIAPGGVAGNGSSKMGAEAAGIGGESRAVALHQPEILAILESSFGRAPGLVHGQVAMQIPQDAASAKYGMHLSKSTYQRSTPRTVCFCGWIAAGGQARVHAWQL